MSVSRRSHDQCPPAPSRMDPLMRMIAPGSARSSANTSFTSSMDSVPSPAIDTVVANSAIRTTKRLSMNFPIQPIDTTASSRTTLSASEPTSTPLSPPLSSSHAPTDHSADFMVTLAAQERRVFELKEELNRAETELAKLKKQWAHHEAYKKRSELRSAEQKLRPVKNVAQLAELQADEDPEDLMIRRGVELDKRRALLLGLSKDSRRTVISGGHTRALSLLSPDRINGLHTPSYQTLNDLRSPTPEKASTGTETENGFGGPIIRSDPRVRHSYQETGQHTITGAVGLKDIAEDLKAGLWNFMDDLRQATIGQEAVESPPKKVNKKPSNINVTNTTSSSRQSSNSRAKPVRLQKQSTPRPVTPPSPAKKEEEPLINLSTPKKKTDSGLGGLDDDWGNWDSPISIRSIGGTYIDGNERPSTSSSESRKDALPTKLLPLKSNEEIPWPALEDFSPQGLQRTASAIVKEWERGLTSTPVDDVGDQKDHDRLKREEETRLLLSNLP